MPPLKLKLYRCECGCGTPTYRRFKAGHDQKLRIALEKQVGGLLNLRAVVENHLKQA